MGGICDALFYRIAADHTADHTPGRTAGRIAGRTADHTPGHTAGRTAGHIVDGNQAVGSMGSFVDNTMPSSFLKKFQATDSRRLKWSFLALNRPYLQKGSAAFTLRMVSRATMMHASTLTLSVTGKAGPAPTEKVGGRV